MRDNIIFKTIEKIIIHLITSNIDTDKIVNKKIIFNYNGTIIRLINTIIRNEDPDAYSCSVNLDKINSSFTVTVFRKTHRCNKKDYNISMKFDEENIELEIKYLEEENNN